MAIVKEFYKTRKDGVNLYRTYSDEGYMIHKINTEEIYNEAIDVENAPYEYEETTEKPEEDLSEIEQKAKAYDILTKEACNPPTIKSLSKMVFLNEQKLKAGFLAKYHILELLILIIFQVCLQFSFHKAYTERNCHNIVDQLYPNTKLKVFFKL